MEGALDVLLAPESRARAAEEQSTLRERHGQRVPTDPALVTFFWGSGRAQAILAQIESNDFTSHGGQLLQQLAEAYADQSRFDDAATVTPDDEQRKIYLAYAKAIANVGQRQCQCAEIKTYPNPQNAKGFRVASLRDVLRVSDGDRIFTLKSCLHCGAISAY